MGAAFLPAFAFGFAQLNELSTFLGQELAAFFVAFIPGLTVFGCKFLADIHDDFLVLLGNCLPLILIHDCKESGGVADRVISVQ